VVNVGARGCKRHIATSRKVAGSIPDDVTVLLAALGSAQPVTEISVRNISWG
jgi:hypothetical protein